MTTLNHLLTRHHRVLFYGAWLMINLVQAAGTELFDDEAYYWVYSRFLDWGYFDHPPTQALLIRAGCAIFPNEFGVRIFTVLLSTASLLLIEDLTVKKNPKLFYAVCLSIALAQIGGMMAVPDTPLMFFVALFFWLYRRFLLHSDIYHALLLGISIALMLYTKYHGVLVVLFTLISNPRLLRQPLAYAAVLTAAALFVPHAIWQYEHAYPSVVFHLKERNSAAYELNHTLSYMAGQILLAGPVVGWLLIAAGVRHKPVDLLEKALKFSFVGIYLFFLVSTLKGRAEANWTIPSYIGLIVLSHQFFNSQHRMRKWLYRSLPVTVLLVAAARTIMILDMPPKWWLAKDEFHGNQVWADVIKEKAGQTPVVVLDAYQKPSKYWFYSGVPSMALNTPQYRRNNYNFWKLEDSLIGKRVFVIGKYDSSFLNRKLSTAYLQKDGWRNVERYYSFSRIMVGDLESRPSGDTLELSFTARSPAHYLPLYQQQPYDTCGIYAVIYEKKELKRYVPTGFTIKDLVDDSRRLSCRIPVSGLTGGYSVKIAVSTCVPGRPSLNSSSIPITLR